MKTLSASKWLPTTESQILSLGKPRVWEGEKEREGVGGVGGAEGSEKNGDDYGGWDVRGGGFCHGGAGIKKLYGGGGKWWMERRWW